MSQLLRSPTLFGRLMGGVMGPEHVMTMGEMMESVSRVFGQTLLYSLLVAALGAAATAVAASLFTARRIARPIGRMLEATRRISAGRYGERVPPAGDDELGALSESFNAMAAALEETEQRRREFIADVSHELRTPLSTLQGYMEGLMDGVVEPSGGTWALLHAETARMRRLVEDLQQLNSAEVGQLALHPEPVPAPDVVEAATESMLPLFAEKGVELRSILPENLPPVAADRDRTAQVLTNLLANALGYTPPGGRVTVSLRAQREGGDGRANMGRERRTRPGDGLLVRPARGAHQRPRYTGTVGRGPGTSPGLQQPSDPDGPSNLARWLLDEILIPAGRRLEVGRLHWKRVERRDERRSR